MLDELAAFMADPATRELAIRRREDERSEAETFIHQGTPHTLLCTKNDRSHQHEL